MPGNQDTRPCCYSVMFLINKIEARAWNVSSTLQTSKVRNRTMKTMKPKPN